jgi:hypothetical protein
MSDMAQMFSISAAMNTGHRRVGRQDIAIPD